jgi:hypothetical protein
MPQGLILTHTHLFCLWCPGQALKTGCHTPYAHRTACVRPMLRVLHPQHLRAWLRLWLGLGSHAIRAHDS